MTAQDPAAAAAKTCHLSDKHPGRLPRMMDAVLTRKGEIADGGRIEEVNLKRVIKKGGGGVVKIEKR